MKTIAILGGTGLLGLNLAKFLKDHFNVIATIHTLENCEAGINFVKVDATDKNQLTSFLLNTKPDIVINCVAYTDVDGCEKNHHLAKQLNSELPKNLVQILENSETKIIQISTDQLFNGKSNTPYLEADQPSPLNFYAQTKLEAEKSIRSFENHIIIRTNFFGSGHSWRPSYSDWIKKNLTENKEIKIFEDVFFNPISLNRLCQFLEKLILGNKKGTYNIGSKNKISKYKFAQLIARKYGLESDLIKPSSIKFVTQTPLRPAYMVLSPNKLEKELGIIVPEIEQLINEL